MTQEDRSVRTSRPEGIWGAVLLPVGEDGEIDFAALADEIDFLCESRLAGIYTNGTAGEFFNQTEGEFDQVSEMVADRARRLGKPFQIGVSNSNPRLARERLRRVRALNPNAVQITLPDWWPPSAAEQARFVTGMQAEAAETALVLYNPPHAKVQLDLSDIAVLRDEAPSLFGIKVKGGGKSWYAERRALLPDFSVFVAGHTVAFGRPLGANGSYSNVACLSPDGAVRYWELIETDLAAAKDLEARFAKLVDDHLMPLANSQGLSNAALDKLMAAAGGWGPIGPRLLWPHSGADRATVNSIGSAARRLLPELF
ncbi:MAG: dihydrodipicolinate synthase family protein [Pseudomonadota bacterium]